MVLASHSEASRIAPRVIACDSEAYRMTPDILTTSAETSKMAPEILVSHQEASWMTPGILTAIKKNLRWHQRFFQVIEKAASSMTSDIIAPEASKMELVDVLVKDELVDDEDMEPEFANLDDEFFENDADDV